MHIYQVYITYIHILIGKRRQHHHRLGTYCCPLGCLRQWHCCFAAAAVVYSSRTHSNSTALLLCRLRRSHTTDQSRQRSISSIDSKFLTLRVVAHRSELYPRWRIQGSDRSNCEQSSTSCSIVANWFVVACSLHCCCCCLRLWSVLPAQSVQRMLSCKNTKNRTYVNLGRPRAEIPGNRLLYSRRKKNCERTPREQQCSDRAQTLTTGSGRPSCVDVINVLVISARTKRYDRIQTKFHKYTYT